MQDLCHVKVHVLYRISRDYKIVAYSLHVCVINHKHEITNLSEFGLNPYCGAGENRSLLVIFQTIPFQFCIIIEVQVIQMQRRRA